MNKVESGFRAFTEGKNCCQAVLRAFAEEMNIEKDTADDMGREFGAGMGCGEICGALTGGIIVLGMLKSIDGSGRVLREEFKQTHGSIICKELLEGNPTVEKEKEIILERGLFQSKCPEFVKNTIKIVESIEKGNKTK